VIVKQFDKLPMVEKKKKKNKARRENNER